ncbi:MAG: hypothetical protein RIE52_00475 [Balneola sp.]
MELFSDDSASPALILRLDFLLLLGQAKSKRDAARLFEILRVVVSAPWLSISTSG